MYPIERQQTILNIINKKKSASVEELSKSLYICAATIRRDLEKMEKLGQIKRTHGGAISLGGITEDAPLLLRQAEQIHSKVKISQIAATMVSSGMAIALDGSSTCLRMLPYLAKIQPLTIITNSASPAFNSLHDINILSTGGKLNTSTMTYSGAIATRTLENFTVDICFFSAKGISMNEGITDSLSENVEIKQVMLRRAKKKVFLCDHTKINNAAFMKICGASDIDLIITDHTLTKEWSEHFSEQGVKILL